MCFDEISLNFNTKHTKIYKRKKALEMPGIVPGGGSSSATCGAIRGLNEIIRSADHNHAVNQWRRQIGRGDCYHAAFSPSSALPLSPSSPSSALVPVSSSSTARTRRSQRVLESDAVLHDFLVETAAAGQRAPLIAPIHQQQQQYVATVVSPTIVEDVIKAPQPPTLSSHLTRIGRRVSTIELKVDDMALPDVQPAFALEVVGAGPSSRQASRASFRHDSATGGPIMSRASVRQESAMGGDDGGGGAGDNNNNNSKPDSGHPSRAPSKMSCIAGPAGRLSTMSNIKAPGRRGSAMSNITDMDHRDVEEDAEESEEQRDARAKRRNASHYVAAEHRCGLNEIAARTLRQLALLHEAQEFDVDSARARQMEAVQYDEVHYQEQQRGLSSLAPLKLRWDHLMQQPLKSHFAHGQSQQQQQQQPCATMTLKVMSPSPPRKKMDENDPRPPSNPHQHHNHHHQPQVFFPLSQEHGRLLPKFAVRSALTAAGAPSTVVPGAGGGDADAQAQLVDAISRARYGTTFLPRKREHTHQRQRSRSPLSATISPKLPELTAFTAGALSTDAKDAVKSLFNADVVALSIEKSSTLKKRKFLDLSETTINGGNRKGGERSASLDRKENESSRRHDDDSDTVMSLTQRKALDVAAILAEVDATLESSPLAEGGAIQHHDRHFASLSSPTHNSNNNYHNGRRVSQSQASPSPTSQADKMLVARDKTLFNAALLALEDDFWRNGMVISAEVQDRMNRLQRDEANNGGMRSKTSGIERGAVVRELLRQSQTSAASNPALVAAAQEQRRRQDEMAWRHSYVRGMQAVAHSAALAQKTAAELGLTSVGIPRHSSTRVYREPNDDHALVHQRMHQSWALIQKQQQQSQH